MKAHLRSAKHLIQAARQLQNKIRSARRLFFITLILSGCGLLMMASSSWLYAYEKFGHPFYFLLRHASHMAIGVAAMFAVSTVKITYFRKWARPLLLVSVVLLLLGDLLPADGATGATRAMVSRIDPPKIAELAIVIWLASSLKNHRTHPGLRFAYHNLLALAPTGLLLALVMMTSPGRYFPLALILIAMVFLADLPLWLVWTVTMVCLAGLLWLLRAPYALQRLAVFLEPLYNPSATLFGCALAIPISALRCGGLFGVGLGNSIYTKSLVGEHAHTDFIFSTILEETGVSGALVIMAMFAILLRDAVAVARRSTDSFGYTAGAGIATALAINTFAHIGGTIGLVPMSGVPLPLLSYGGASTIITFVQIGILLSIANRTSGESGTQDLNHKPKSRMTLFQFVMILLFAAALCRLLALAFIVRRPYIGNLDDRMTHVEVIPATRGRILDREGLVIATDIPGVSVGVNPTLVEDAEALADVLHETLAIDPARVLESIKKQPCSRFRWARRGLPLIDASIESDVKALEEKQLAGVHIINHNVRYYPCGEYAASLIGLTGIDGYGLEGLEYKFDRFLEGKPGRRLLLKDGAGRKYQQLSSIPPEHGRDLITTLDMRIVKTMQDELKQIVNQGIGHNTCFGLVLDGNTGEVLGYASLPTFDPNDRGTIHQGKLVNRVVRQTFPPGVLLDFLLGFRWTSEPYASIRKEARVYHGRLKAIDFTDRAISSLCLPEKGKAEIDVELLHSLNLGYKTGIEVPGECPGSIPGTDILETLALAEEPVGNIVLVTPIQLVVLFSRVVFENIHIKPTVIQRPPQRKQVYQTQRGAPKITDSVVFLLEGTTKPDIPASLKHLYEGANLEDLPLQVKDGDTFDLILGWYELGNGKVVCLIGLAGNQIREPKDRLIHAFENIKLLTQKRLPHRPV